MSHYRVFVIHHEDQDVDDLLAPYDENAEVEPYIRYTRQEAIDYARKNYYKDMPDKTDEECWQAVAEDYTKTDLDGNIYSTYNPDSKWDWYQIGGRFGNVNDDDTEVKVGEFKNNTDKDEYEHALRFWEINVEGSSLKPEEEQTDYFSLWKPEYYLEKYKTKEIYALYYASDIPYAVITPDGVWHAQGEMGWFGCSDDNCTAEEWMNEFNDIIKNSNPEDLIISIDCHI